MKLAHLAAALLASLSAIVPAQTHATQTHTPATLVNGAEPTWWKQTVVYQIYPRSFQDSNGDSIGDLPGIAAKLDYLQSLGVNILWLNPHFDSPKADNSYDIRDYRKVMAECGTMADFDRMPSGLSSRTAPVPSPSRLPRSESINTVSGSLGLNDPQAL